MEKVSLVAGSFFGVTGIIIGAVGSHALTIFKERYRYNIVSPFMINFFTKVLNKLTGLGGMKLHDHIFIGDEKYYSFSEECLLAKL